MNALPKLSFPAPWLVAHSPRGWIGVDVGAASLKLVQVEKVRGELRFAARWTLEMEGGSPAGGPEALLERFTAGLPALKRARQAFQGSLCAAACSMSAAAMRAFDLPAGSDEERDCMVREELHSENETALEEICFDSWMSEGSSPSSASSAQVSVVALPRKSIEKLAEQLGRAGLDCVVLDGLPCALARALAIGPDAGSQPAIALDMGAASATLVLAQGGRPLFARQLRGCGLDAFLTPLVERLSLAPEEARHLLFHVGIAPAATNPSGASAPNATHQLLGEPVAHLKNELRRTLGYMDQRLRSHLPHEIVLLGGGALIPNLASGIASETGIPTRLWRLGEASGSPSDPVFGVATALSLLAWENPPCI